VDVARLGDTTVSGITKGSATNSLTAHRLSRAAIGFAVVSGSAPQLLLSRRLKRREDRFDISAL
jgi:hypothetical protein